MLSKTRSKNINNVITYSTAIITDKLLQTHITVVSMENFHSPWKHFILHENVSFFMETFHSPWKHYIFHIIVSFSMEICHSQWKRYILHGNVSFSMDRSLHLQIFCV